MQPTQFVVHIKNLSMTKGIHRPYIKIRACTLIIMEAFRNSILITIASQNNKDQVSGCFRLQV